MSTERSLHRRITLTLALFAAVVTFSLAVVIYLSSHNLEEQLIDETLNAELDDFIARRARNPLSQPEQTKTIRGYVVNSAADPDTPPRLASLEPGLHSLQIAGIPYRAAVRQEGAQRFVVLYDYSAMERREQSFLLLLAASVLLITTIAGFTGRRLAAQTIAPVNELARRVAQLDPEESPNPLAADFPWLEVKRLAADFDAYLLRLHEFIERERLFTGDVSHELRTPIAVISGASELLLNDPDLDDRKRERVARIARAVTEMGEISGALLALAREADPAQQQSPPLCDVVTLAGELLARYRNLLHGKPVTLDLAVITPPTVYAENAVLAMVLGNLLRNAIAYTEAGEVRVVLDSGEIRVEDTGPGIGDQGSDLFLPYRRSRDSSGAGLGLSLVKRLCERQGWRISLANRPEGGTVARLALDGIVPGTTSI